MFYLYRSKLEGCLEEIAFSKKTAQCSDIKLISLHYLFCTWCTKKSIYLSRKFSILGIFGQANYVSKDLQQSPETQRNTILNYSRNGCHELMRYKSKHSNICCSPIKRKRGSIRNWTKRFYDISANGSMGISQSKCLRVGYGTHWEK